MNLDKCSAKQPLIKIHKELILFLNNLPPKKRAAFVSLLKKTQIDCISEIFKKFLNSNLTQDKPTIRSIKKYRNDIKTVALKKTPLKQKIKILTSQRGGAILSVLLPLAASLIGGLLPR